MVKMICNSLNGRGTLIPSAISLSYDSRLTPVLTKVIIILLLLAMIFSLGYAMMTMMREKGRGTGTVKALTYRVGIWIVLFILIVVGLYTGAIKPSGSLQKAAIQTQTQ